MHGKYLTDVIWLFHLLHINIHELFSQRIRLPFLTFQGSRPGHFKKLRTGDARLRRTSLPPPCSPRLRSEPGGPPFRNVLEMTKASRQPHRVSPQSTSCMGSGPLVVDIIDKPSQRRTQWGQSLQKRCSYPLVS